MDGYFNQAEESLSFMATDMNVQTTIGSYVWGTYKERLDLGDFLRNRLANMSTVGRRTGAISIYDWGRVMAAAVGAAIPILVIFIFLQKYRIPGLTSGAVKE